MTISATNVVKALAHIGLDEPAQRRVSSTFVLLQFDSLLSACQAGLEEDLSFFVENCELLQMGLLSIDEVMKSVTALAARLDVMSAEYRKVYFFDRAERVQEAKKIIANAMCWA